MQPRKYQNEQVNNVARLMAKFDPLLVQLPTGGGKTVEFSMITNRWVQKFTTSVLILVHRQELLRQTRRTLAESFGINSQPIIAGMGRQGHIPVARVYVGMVETVNKRWMKLHNIGLIIADECHRAEFDKILPHFPNAKKIGFTASPIRTNKKNPLKNHYQEIVVGPQIKELIALNKAEPGQGLCQNITYIPAETVKRTDLKMKGDDFDVGMMSIAFSKPKYVQSVIDAYKKYCEKTKAIVFNVDITHSILVMNAFVAAGYDARHIDGTTLKKEREYILQWYHCTPGAILCNVDIATTGFDEKTIETVIVNRSTQSLSLWLQMCGRGSRPIAHYKDLFYILDMGSNGIVHGDWCDDRDFYQMFHFPPEPGKKKDNVAPVKICPECQALVPAQARTCPYCEYEFPGKPPEPEKPIDSFNVFTTGIDVENLILKHRHKKKFQIFYEIGIQMAVGAKASIKVMNDEHFEFILASYIRKAQEWSNLHLLRGLNNDMLLEARKHLTKELEKYYPDFKHAVYENA